MNKLRLATITLLLSLQFVFASPKNKVYHVSDVPNVQLMDKSRYVSDPENYLSSETVYVVDAKLAELRRNFGVEAVVVVIPSTGKVPIETFALDLLRQWGVGSSKNNNGIVVVATIEDHQFRIETGYGSEATITDATAIMLFDRYVKEPFKAGNYNKGICDVIDGIYQQVASYSNPEQTNNNMPTNSIRWHSPLLYALLAGLFLVGIVIFVTAISRIKQSYKHYGAYATQQASRIALANTLWLVVLSLPLAIILGIWYYGFYSRRIKVSSQYCPNCNQPTFHKCGLQNSNIASLVSLGQLVEQKLGSVIYGGAYCSNCGFGKVYRLQIPNSKYSVCPICHTRSYHIYKTEIFNAGNRNYERKYYKCENCQYTETHDTPTNNNDKNMLLRGIIIGSILSRRNRGGGYGGYGGFGGGSGGGGGATGSW